MWGAPAEAFELLLQAQQPPGAACGAPRGVCFVMCTASRAFKLSNGVVYQTAAVIMCAQPGLSGLADSVLENAATPTRSNVKLRLSSVVSPLATVWVPCVPHLIGPASYMFTT